MAQPPRGVITPAEAKTLDQAFDSRHQLISNSIVKRPDNRSSWYSLQDMRDYLDYAACLGNGATLGFSNPSKCIWKDCAVDKLDSLGATLGFSNHSKCIWKGCALEVLETTLGFSNHSKDIWKDCAADELDGLGASLGFSICSKCV